MKKYLVLMTLLVSMSACASDPPSGSVDRIKEVNKIYQEIVDSQCDSDPLVGEESGINIILKAKRNELKEAEGLISISKYNKLSQELAGYSVEWELINREIMHACRRDAMCRAKHYQGNRYCSEETAAYERATEKAHAFLLKLKQLEIRE